MLKKYMEVYPDKPNWCTLLKYLLCTLGKYRIRFLYIVEQRETMGSICTKVARTVRAVKQGKVLQEFIFF